MRRAVLALSPVLALAACLSPTGGGDETGSGESSGSTGDMTPTTGSTGPAPTTGTTDAPADCAEGCKPEEACVGGTCEFVGRTEIEAGCHPLGDPQGRGQCPYPWPSNFYTAPAAASPTKLEVALPATLLPVNTQQQEFPADALLNGAPGFSPHAQIRFAVASAIDPAPLPPIDDIGRSLAEDAPIVLLRASTGERWPFFAEVDATREPGDPQTIFVRPMRRLAEGERFIVAIRELSDESGQAIAPTPLFRALRDELATDVPQLEQERGRYAEIFAALADAGVARESLQLAWDFTTNTAEALQRDFTAIRPQVEALAQAGDLGYAIDEVIEDPGSSVPLRIHGTFTVPNCLEDDGATGSVFKRDADGLPECSGTTEAPFYLAVPAAVYDTKTPSPVVLYGHGLLGTGEEALSVAEQTGQMVVIGTDFWGMSEEDIPTVIAMLGTNFGGGATIADRLLQSTVNFTTLGYLAQGELVGEPALQGLIDPSAVYYIGGSQGGIMGGTVTAMAPNVERGVLVVGGANYSLMVWRSTAFAEVNDVWKATQPNVQNREFLFSLFQAVFDRADPLTYLQPLADDKLLLVESIGDAQVPNISSEMMARSYGMSLVTPSVRPVWGLDDAPPMFDGSALLLVDTKKGPLPPSENLPAADDNGAHGSSTDTAAVQEIIAAFLSKGIVQNVCTDACDPD